MEPSGPPPLLFEQSCPGRTSSVIAPSSDATPIADLIPADFLADAPPNLPEIDELSVVRHYVRLSQLNFAIDRNFYPLGSCTMKYNPKRNERIASFPGFAHVHPHQEAGSIQGLLRILYELQNDLAEIAGLHAVSLQPAAGAHGELTALLVAAAHFRKIAEYRTNVLVPDSAHGTNPSSAHIAGFDTVTVKSGTNGLVDLDDLKAKLDDKTAVFMITNPNTAGLFDHQIGVISAMLREKGALMYLDGANMNAILGIVRPGDMGADLMHYNPHKTFSGPHGGGGPGAGPIAVREHLAKYLPAPMVVRREEGHYDLDYDRPDSIGRVRATFGNVGVLVRAWAYIRSQGPDGLKNVSEMAVLNANYLLSQLMDVYPTPMGSRCMHEFVASARSMSRETGVRAMDIAKRLLDYGYHAPTVYFPLIIAEALMIEPTETESKQTLDGFIEAMRIIATEAPDLVHSAPLTTPVDRPDEVRAAKHPVLRWTPA
jgi:glycine dehydrogenase subunit 2